MSPEQQQLQSGIQAFEAQRGLLGDAVVDMALAPLKARLAALRGDVMRHSRSARMLLSSGCRRCLAKRYRELT